MSWYRDSRRDLPWRRLQSDAYAVWVSEIMLQQTQVATVLSYYDRWMARFPTVEALAAADEEAVLGLWAGLGYYARARNLHRAAREVVVRHGGVLPKEERGLRRLPGIGRYTAAAIHALAYDEPAVVVDTNVARVICRLFGIDADPKSADGARRIAGAVEVVTAGLSPRDAGQALMELGALVCSAADPACGRCPALRWCCAAASSDPTAWPVRRAGKPMVAVTHACAAVRRGERLLVARRHPHGLWGGLWEMPRRVCENGESPEEAAFRAAREVVGIDARPVRRLGTIRHTVTHHAIRLHLVACDAGPCEPAPLDCAEVRWLVPEEGGELAVSSPQRAALTAVFAQVRRDAAPK